MNPNHLFIIILIMTITTIRSELLLLNTSFNLDTHNFQDSVSIVNSVLNQLTSQIKGLPWYNGLFTGNCTIFPSISYCDFSQGETRDFTSIAESRPSIRLSEQYLPLIIQNDILFATVYADWRRSRRTEILTDLYLKQHTCSKSLSISLTPDKTSTLSVSSDSSISSSKTYYQSHSVSISQTVIQSSTLSDSNPSSTISSQDTNSESNSLSTSDTLSISNSDTLSKTPSVSQSNTLTISDSKTLIPSQTNTKTFSISNEKSESLTTSLSAKVTQSSSVSNQPTLSSTKSRPLVLTCDCTTCDISYPFSWTICSPVGCACTLFPCNPLGPYCYASTHPGCGCYWL
jgi:hypothetical protein